MTNTYRSHRYSLSPISQLLQATTMRLLSLVLLVAAASAATLEPTQTLEPRQAVIVATEPPSLSHASPSPTASRSSASSTSFSGSSQAPTSYFIGVTSVSKGTIITASPTSTSSSTLTRKRWASPCPTPTRTSTWVSNVKSASRHGSYGSCTCWEERTPIRHCVISPSAQHRHVHYVGRSLTPQAFPTCSALSSLAHVRRPSLAAG
jgi:hypothetical protein